MVSLSHPHLMRCAAQMPPNIRRNHHGGLYRSLALLCMVLSLVFAPRAYAQILDPTFVIGTGFDNEVRSFIEIPGSQIIVVGNFTSYNGTPVNRVARLNFDGTIDATFTPPSNAVINGRVNTVIREAGGNLIIAGQFNGGGREYVARLTAAGTLDATFTQTGTGLNGEVNALALDGGGNVVAVGLFTSYNGTARNRIARLTTGGALDGTFTVGTGFVGGIGANSVTIDGSGNILVGGTFISYNGTPSSRIARILNTGTIDGTFALGTGFNAVVNSIVIDASNKILVGGDFTAYNGAGSNRIIRLNTGGTVDGTFTTGGGFDGIVNSIFLEASGKPIVGGGFTTYNATGRNNIARLNTGGTLDNTFNPGNGFDNPAQVVAVQSDGKILVGGQFGTYNTSSAVNRIARFGFAAATFVASAIFPEAVANDGSVTATRTITLGPVGGSPMVESWTTGVANGSNFTAGVQYTVANVPAGLTLVVTKTSSLLLTLSLTGNATLHANANDVSNLQITFLNGALEGNNAIGVQNLNSNLFTVDFIDPSGAAYSATTFNETAAANNGSISTSRTIILSGGETWNAGVANGSPLTSGVHYTVVNVPPGLTEVLTKNSSTQVTITFTGNAAAHAAANSVINAQFTFLNAAVTGGNAGAVVGLNGQNLSVNFLDPNSAAFSGTTFPEAVANNGTVTATRTITLTSETWTGGVANGSPFIAGTHYTVANVPAGLTMVITKNSAGVATISFPGAAAAHANVNDVTNVQITFLNAAVASANIAGTAGINGVSLTVDFIDPAPTATYSGTTFAEAFSNNGSVPTTRTITLLTETWNAGIANGSNLAAGTDFTVANVPPGLTAVVTKNSALQVTISFTGAAINNNVINNVNNVLFTFLAPSVTSGLPGTVAGLNTQNLSINFTDPVGATYSSTQMTESSNNTGFSSDIINVTLVGTDWITSGAFTPGTHFTATGVPAGMTMVVAGVSPSVAQVRLVGLAFAHAAANSTPITLTFFNAAVTNANVSFVTGLTPATITLTFIDPAPPAPPAPAPPPIPTVLQLSTLFGQTGDPVVISGFNFTGVTNVQIGGVPVQSFTVNSPFEIRAIVGSGATGRVQVTNGFGSGTSGSVFTFGPAPPPVPTIFSVSPEQATFGESVTILGQMLSGATEVRVGGVPVQTFSVRNDRAITFTVNSPFSGAVEVVTPQGILTLASGIVYKKLPSPVITALDPNTLESGDEEAIMRLIGQNFTNVGTVTIMSPRGGTSVAVITANPNGKEAVISFPASFRLPGIDSLRFLTPDGQLSNAVALNIIPAPKPQVGGITILPSASSTTANNQAFSIAIDGENFFKAAKITLSGKSATGAIPTDFPLRMTVVSPGRAIVEIPAEINRDGGTFTLHIENPDGNSINTPFSIKRRPAPSIGTATTTTRTSSTGEQEIVFVIQGQSFFDPQIEYMGTPLTLVSWSPEQIIVRLTPQLVQKANSSWIPPVLAITNGDKQVTGVRLFLSQSVGGIVPDPIMPSINQLTVLPAATSTSATGKPFSIKLTGTRFANTAEVVLSGSDVSGRAWQNLKLKSQVIDPSQVIVEIPADVNKESGTYTVQLLNSSAAATQATLNITCGAEPTMSSATPSPRQAQTGAIEQTIILRGQNFNDPTLEVLNTPVPVISWTPTEIIARIPDQLARKANAACKSPLVLLRNADGKTDALRAGMQFSLSQIAQTAVTFQTALKPTAQISAINESSPKVAKASVSADADDDTTDETELAELKLYPNPASEYVIVTLPATFSRAAPVRISIVDARGQESLRLNETAQTRQVRIPLAKLSSGAYRIVISNGAQTLKQAVMIAR